MITSSSKWGISEIFDGVLFDITTNEPLARLEDFKSLSFDNSGETIYATGGAGAPKLIGWGSNKQCKLTVQNGVLSDAALAVQLGNDPVTATTTIYTYTDVFQATATTSATLTKTPSGTGTTSVGYIFKMNADGSLGEMFTQDSTASAADKFAVSSKTVTFHASSTLVANDWLVAFYAVTTSGTAVTLTNKTDVFSKTTKVVLSGLVRDKNTAVDYAAQIIIWRMKWDNNFKIDLNEGGQPAVHDLVGDAMDYVTGTTHKYWDIIICDESTIS